MARTKPFGPHTGTTVYRDRNSRTIVHRLLLANFHPPHRHDLGSVAETDPGTTGFAP